MKTVAFCLIISLVYFKTSGARLIAAKQGDRDSWLYMAIFIGNDKALLVRQLFFTDSNVQSHAIAARPGSLLKYGKLNVMEVHLKPNVKLRGIDHFLDEYHIKREDRVLPIMIDSSYTYDYPLNTIMVADHSIRSINIQIDPASKQRYLNINTGAKRYKTSGPYIN